MITVSLLQNKTDPAAYRRLFWIGSAALAAFAICAVFVIRDNTAAESSQSLSQDVTISMFECKEVSVLWAEGLKSWPADYAAK